MGQLIPKEVIEQIRIGNDIAEVLGSYIQLKRAGGRFKALCPFHKEKTPSFHVNPQRQIFHCFGCGAGGDVFEFVMKYEGVDFTTAARILAERAGMALRFEEGSSPDTSEKETLLAIHEEATRIFHKLLQESPDAQIARDYLAERGMDDDIVSEFRLGYAPDGWNTMEQMAREKRFTAELMGKSGLVSANERKPDSPFPFYDRFRGRLMIPILDQLGRVIAFSGRVLSADQKGGKYVNSPETPLFYKNRVLFALDKARHAIVDSRTAILCEGQIDVIRCHQAGIRNVVAAQGTALTENHARIVKRYADDVILVLDSDKAGQDAAIRSLEFFLALGMRVRIAELPEGEDPDSMIRTQGPDPFLKVIEEAPAFIDFQINLLQQREDFSSETGLMNATKALIETLSKVPSEIHRDQLIHHCAERLNIREEALRADYRRTERPRPARRQPQQQEAPRPQDHILPEERLLIELLLKHPETADLFDQYLSADHVRDATCRNILYFARQYPDSPNELMNALRAEYPEGIPLAAAAQMAPHKYLSEDNSPIDAARDIILRIRQKRLEERRTELRSKLRNMPGTAPETRALREESALLIHDIHQLRQGWEIAQPLLEM